MDKEAARFHRENLSRREKTRIMEQLLTSSSWDDLIEKLQSLVTPPNSLAEVVFPPEEYITLGDFLEIVCNQESKAQLTLKNCMNINKLQVDWQLPTFALQLYQQKYLSNIENRQQQTA